MKIGGQILWNVIPICETFKISCLMEGPCERRFGVPRSGSVIPFGAMVEYHPIFVKRPVATASIRSKVLPGLFLRCALHAEGIWKGDILVADIEDLEQMDAAKRLNAEEVLKPMRGEKFIFPIADGTVKLSGGDQVDRTDRGEEQGNLQGESDGSSSTPIRHLSWYDGDARNDVWCISGNFFTAVTWNPESNCSCREKNHFLFH